MLTLFGLEPNAALTITGNFPVVFVALDKIEILGALNASGQSRCRSEWGLYTLRKYQRQRGLAPGVEAQAPHRPREAADPFAASEERAALKVESGQPAELSMARPAWCHSWLPPREVLVLVAAPEREEAPFNWSLPRSITVAAGGSINVGGGGGLFAGTNTQEASGGGSGGAILLEARASSASLAFLLPMAEEEALVAAKPHRARTQPRPINRRSVEDLFQQEAKEAPGQPSRETTERRPTATPRVEEGAALAGSASTRSLGRR